MTQFLLKKFVKDYRDTTNPDVRERVGVLSGTIGILCNIFLFVIKLIVGLVSQSMAMISDAFNNLSDMASSVINILGSKVSNKPADKGHPYGHGRFEYVSTLFVGVIITYVGISLLISSIEKMMNPKAVSINKWLVIVMIISIIIKLWMYYTNNDWSKRIESNLLLTTAQDSLNDVWVTLALLVAFGIEYFTKLKLDGFASLIISLLIIYTGYQSVVSTISILLGQRPNPELEEKITELISKDIRILGYHDIQVHDYGPSRVHASVDIELDDSLDLQEAHTIIDEIEQSISSMLDISLTSHIDPVSSDIMVTQENIRIVNSLIHKLNLDLQITNYRCIKGTIRTTIMGDVLVDDQNRNHILSNIANLQRKLFEEYPHTILDIQIIEN